jgi:multiple sugar transport system permease protein
LAHSGSSIQAENETPGRSAGGLNNRYARRAIASLGAWRSDGAARWVFIWPTVLIILFISILPTIGSLTLSLSHLVFQQGGIQIDFVGFANYTVLLFGTERTHFLGLLRPPNVVGLAIFGVGAATTVWLIVRAARSGEVRRVGLFVRIVAGLLFLGFLWLCVQALASQGGRPGSLIVTFIFVIVGITAQFFLGLGLAMLALQPLPFRRFFRVAFLIPLTITPVGIGYMFLMMTDTSKGPFEPLWVAAGLRNYSWVTDPWAARIAVLIGDTWQWTPFVFIVLLAALEAQDMEVLEAAYVDGASRWQTFLHITLPSIVPVSTTIVLIRLIEGFKIVDMPNILLGGGPGTATQSLTLQAYLDWNTLNLGRSAAIAYLLLIVVTIVATAYVSLVRRRVTDYA